MEDSVVPGVPHILLLDFVGFEHAFPELALHVGLAVHETAVTQDHNNLLSLALIVDRDLQKGLFE